jgi:parvulin-like peptidyl-prolyl isomerase
MVSDKVIADRYDAIVAGKPGPEEVRFQVIATATEPDARIALNFLSKGTDFSTLAMQVSKDPSAVNGGEIGYARRDRLTPEIGAVVFALVPGQTTAFPVFSNNMWFVIHVEGRRQQGTPTFAEAKADLTSELTREASQEILQKTLAAVVVNDYGPTGARGHEQQAPPTAH